MGQPDFTHDEKIAMDRICEFRNEFARLPAYHPCDSVDVDFHVHAIQNILMSRIAVRLMPKDFVNRSAIG